jgi:hypothetical protein
MDHYAGPKSIGSWWLTQAKWILTQNPRPIGSAPKRIIIKKIIFIPQIIIFFY